MKKTEYKPERIESYWQKYWEENGTFSAHLDPDREKYYILIEFPYPSGEGLHVGHPRSYTALDIVSRMKRMQGYNVLYPIGWDAFGLPTENYAMKNNIHPRRVTEENVSRFKKQLQSLGFSFDWEREVNTSDPDYYKWTQWIFLQLFKHGLAYKSEMPINWCTDCRVGLANEEVVGGVCERCGGEVVSKVKEQWMLKITDYAQRLLDDLETVDYLEKIKAQQRNWIGRSEGAEIRFPIAGSEEGIEVFTTRPDTLWGATYMVLSPEHPLLEKLADEIQNMKEVQAYQKQAASKTEFERTEEERVKTGVALEGIWAINPGTGKEIPVWIADYVMMTYGTGAIMAVPGHDQRDWEFARQFDLPIVEVIKGGDISQEAYTDTEAGILVNSDFIDGFQVQEAIEKVIDWLEEKGLGKRKVNYKLRDWVFSRQRYWGEPIPLVECPSCGWVPVPEEELPLVLPELEEFSPTGTGESPLARVTDWVETECPSCGEKARRETDTMPQWAGSSWYFLRYTDPKNDEAFAGKEALDYWTPVDWYNGGMEHTTLHLLYSRFWHKFLYDIGVVPTAEPYKKRTSHGMILGENNEKMSKSRGNVVNPDQVVAEFGADTFRVYEMFMGAFDQDIPWSQQGVKGARRFLDRVWRLQETVNSTEDYSPELEVKMHQTIKKVTEDYNKMKYNTAIAALMSLLNEFYDRGEVTRKEFASFLILLNPVAPHITEELWTAMDFAGELNQQKWVEWDEDKTVEETIEIAVQVNGRVRGTVQVPREAGEEEVKEELLKVDSIRRHIDNKEIVKEIYIPGRIMNIVVK